VAKAGCIACLDNERSVVALSFLYFNNLSLTEKHIVEVQYTALSFKLLLVLQGISCPVG